MAETFNIGSYGHALTFYESGSGLTGLQNGVDVRFIRADDSSVVTCGSWVEVGAGKYVASGFNVPAITFTNGVADYQGALNLLVQKWNGASWVTQYGATNTGVIRAYASSSQNDGFDDNPPSRTYVDGRVDAAGDSMYGYLTYVPNGTFTGINASSLQLPSFKQVQDWATGSLNLTGSYVTLGTTQTITGAKTFNIGTDSTHFNIVDSDEPTAATLLGVHWKTGGKSTFNFYSSSLALSGSIQARSASFWIPEVNTSSPLYTGGNAPATNTLIWLDYLQDNYQPLTTVFTSKTIIVDAQVVTDVLLKYYNTIEAAIQAIIDSGAPSASNTYTLLIKQHKDYSNGYQPAGSSLTIPDYVNLIGEGFVRISATVSRTGLAAYCKMENLHFNADGTHGLDNIDATNCVFSSISDNVTIDTCRLKNVGLYAGGTITSTGTNKIVNCYGNYDVTWLGTDKVYSYDIMVGDTYQ